MTIQEHRRKLHAIPELHKDLPETFAYLTAVLETTRAEVRALPCGGIIAYFDFGKPETLAFRSDADALPIAEKTGASYASRHPGKMHACGHDGHMAVLLELAARIHQKRDVNHNILLIFQPAEETTGGARDICETGILREKNVTAIFGLHVWPGLPAGKIFSRKLEMMARSSELTVDVYGKSAHIAKAAEGIDALEAAMEFYRQALALERSLPKEIFRLLKFGQLHSGTVRNALSAHSHLEGSLRAFRDETFEYLKKGLLDIAAGVEKAFGCTVKVHLSEGYPAVLNDPALYDAVRAKLPFEALAEPCMTAEDFSWYLKEVPGLFFFLGLGDVPALHADTFDFDEGLLTNAAGFLEKLAML